MNWLAELGIILFVFNALFGPVVAIILAVLYLFWGIIKFITMVRIADFKARKIIKEMGCFKNGSKREKK